MDSTPFLRLWVSIDLEATECDNHQAETQAPKRGKPACVRKNGRGIAKDSHSHGFSI